MCGVCVVLVVCCVCCVWVEPAFFLLASLSESHPSIDSRLQCQQDSDYSNRLGLTTPDFANSAPDAVEMLAAVICTDADCQDEFIMRTARAINSAVAASDPLQVMFLCSAFVAIVVAHDGGNTVVRRYNIFVLLYLCLFGQQLLVL